MGVDAADSTVTTSLLMGAELVPKANDDDSDASGAMLAKAIAMVTLFTCSFLVGLLPIKLSKWFKWDSDPKSKSVVSLLLCFGGGVLFCTTFLHLLPEVSEHVTRLTQEGIFPDTNMHFAEVLMCAGFFVMYLVEECVHAYIHRREEKNRMKTLSRTLSIRRGERDASEKGENGDTSQDQCLKTLENGDISKSAANRHSHSHDHNHAGGHSHLVLDDGEEDSLAKNLRGLLVVLALSIHELFEGLAVGLESSPATVWYMFGAVSAHKFVISFCIGVELVSSKTRTLLTVIYVFTFSFVSALGIGIGILVSANEQDSTAIASMILQGIATGTLLYVVFFEILNKENASSGLKSYFSILVGFVIMFGLTFVAGHEHGSSDSAHSGHHHHHHHHPLEHDFSLH